MNTKCKNHTPFIYALYTCIHVLKHFFELLYHGLFSAFCFDTKVSATKKVIPLTVKERYGEQLSKTITFSRIAGRSFIQNK